LSSANIINMKKLPPIEDKIVNFQNPEEIIFPKICVVCGATSEHHYEKTIVSRFNTYRDYKEDYSFNIPVCLDCSTNLKIKTGMSSKSGKLLLISSLLGIVLAISLYFVFYSIWLSVSLVALTIVLPYLNYKAKMKKRIRLGDYLKINLNENNQSLTFNFFNLNYARYIREINSIEESEENPQEFG